MYFFRPTIEVGDNTGGTNFWAQFNPFATTKVNPPTATQPTDISGYEPPAPEEKIKLRKVSSMPIAGFTVYTKERLITSTPATTPDTSATSGGAPGSPTTNTSSTSLGSAPGSPIKNTSTPNKKTTKSTKTVKPTAPPTEFIPALRYVARETGNVYQTFADKLDEKKFSSTIVPKVYEAFLGNNGESVAMRYLKEDGRTIETFVGKLPKELLGDEITEDKEVKGSFLPENVKDISLSQDKGIMFYLFNVGESTVGTTLDLTTNKKTQIFDSVFNEWLSFWSNSKMLTLTTKPSYNVLGYAYSINPSDTSNKNAVKIFGGINGLTTLASPDGKSILYSDNNLSLSVYHTDTKTTDVLGIRTLPEKCVWNKASDTIYCGVPKSIDGNNYPDTWYQGEVSFSDQIWKLNIQDKKSEILVDPITIKSGEEIDGTKLAIDETGNYLFFVNKKDSFLWELDLK
jgi:hypothetical protein